ncbi:MAG: hypothetical protein ACK56F_04705 [bacterium]
MPSEALTLKFTMHGNFQQSAESHQVRRVIVFCLRNRIRIRTVLIIFPPKGRLPSCLYMCM